MKYQHLLLLTFLTIISCNKNQNEEVIEMPNSKWESLEIKTLTETLEISKFSDSVYYEQNLNNVGFRILPEDGKIQQEEKVVKKTVYFTKQEKESLAKYIYESVTEPRFTDVLATDYAGTVSFTYDTGTTALTCKYKSVGDWSKVSEITKKIYELLSKKIDISKS